MKNEEIRICKAEGCNKEISKGSKSGYCRSCFCKERFKDPKKNPNYKGNITKKKYYCIVCNNEIHFVTSLYGTGRCKSCAGKERMKDPENHPGHIDGRFTEKHYCKEPDCNNEISYENWKNGSGGCRECYFKWLKTTEGRRERSLAFDGTGIPYENADYPEEFSIVRPKILKRDNYTCQGCGMIQEKHYKIYNKSLSVHHIDHKKQNSSEYNLITVCQSCNRKADRIDKKANWQDHYNLKIKLIYQNLALNKDKFTQLF